MTKWIDFKMPERVEDKARALRAAMKYAVNARSLPLILRLLNTCDRKCALQPSGIIRLNYYNY